MSATRARQRYLQRHIEPELPASPQPLLPWERVLVIPAYRESPAVLHHLATVPTNRGRALVILVLNRPDSDPDPLANTALRDAVSALPRGCASGLARLNECTDLFLHDLDALSGPLPSAAGVGLARKIGCDIAFKWMSEGAIRGRWICSTDADARLPPDYFDKLDSVPATAVAATFPFRHAPAADSACNLATALYELRLHHYVLGLEYAGSPYSFHTLGSCLAVTFDGYAQVRGVPRRAGAEDFYLLNKLAKIAPVSRLAGECVQLQSRRSARVPFGTGPAVAQISAAQDPRALPLFYHPRCFEALLCFLRAVPLLQAIETSDLSRCLRERLQALKLEPGLAQACTGTMIGMGLEGAVAHCRRHGPSQERFLSHFHVWFDAFRTLKFIHGMRDAGWPSQPLAALASLRPQLWPPGEQAAGVESLRQGVRRHWGWTG